MSSPLKGAFLPLAFALAALSCLSRDQLLAGDFDDGRVAFGKGDYAAAVRFFTKAIERNPKDSEAFSCRGAAYLCQFDEALADHENEIHLKAAIQDYTEAIRLDPRCVPAYVHRGITRSYKQDFDAAIKDYIEAIRLDGDGEIDHRGRFRSSRCRNPCCRLR